MNNPITERWDVINFTEPNKIYIVSHYENDSWKCSCQSDNVKISECKHIRHIKYGRNNFSDYIRLGKCPNCFENVVDEKNNKNGWIKDALIARCPFCNGLFSLEAVDPSRISPIIEPSECLIIGSKKIKWSVKDIKDYEYTYNVWLRKCPFCGTDVNKETILNPSDDNGDFMGTCPHCKSRIGVNWFGMGNWLLKEIQKPKRRGDYRFKEIMYSKFFKNLESPNFFMLYFDGVDDFMDTYQTILGQNDHLARICYFPDGDRAFLVNKNSQSKDIFVNYMRERECDKYVKNWNELFALMFVEPLQLFEFNSNIENRRKRIRNLKKNYSLLTQMQKSIRYLIYQNGKLEYKLKSKNINQNKMQRLSQKIYEIDEKIKSKKREIELKFLE